ncbi:MAG: 23S rRNA (adenine(2503)-C(2))-methyltransferase RlmN [Eubacterium sp.]|nr:23S rRNA (adenine(2503)-C(2))-methyltransferase RlmN [Eubacterium sp.]
MDIRSLSEKEMEELALSLGEKAFRGKQLFQWVHDKRVGSFDEMSNLSASFREKLKEKYTISGVTQVEKQVSQKGDTAKYLFALEDGNVIESVWMKYHHGNSVCISSQVGCRMGCTFCASTLTGLARNLTAGEMLSQIYEIQRDTGERVSNVIVMGMGEPLDNYDNLLHFLRLVSHEKGICISQRNITVSTCGLVEQIRRLAEENLQITLAISLHAPNDEIRRRTMPVANRYGIDEIIQACRDYFAVTGRRITFEYSMIRGVNDKKEHAEELAERLRGLNCHINLIPLNEVRERECLRSRKEDIQQFKLVLEKNHRNVTIRREMGSDIDAACGQLRKKFLTKSSRN